MDADDWVDVTYRLAADVAVCRAGIGGLFVAGVYGPQTVEEVLERGTETVVSLHLRVEDGVAAGGCAVCFREVEDEQEGCTGRIDLIGYI